MKKILVFVAFLSIIFTSNTFAWGRKGHSLVAEVAFHYLDARTKQNVMNYLNGMSIEDAASWMDSMRSNKSYDFMKPYHYIDFEKGEPVTELEGDNIISVLNKTLKELDNPKGLSNEDIRIRILYLFHLVGDLHQPLHAGYKSDKGGNSVKVSLFGRETNLHALWDTDIIEMKGLTLDEVLKSSTYKPNEIAALKLVNIVSWTKDSRVYLKNSYNLTDAKISDVYIDSNYIIIKQQILKAGIRLAGILEHYFKDATFVPSEVIKIKEGAVEKNETPIAIDISKVAEYEGKLVTVCAKVYGAKFINSSSQQPTFLNVGGDYPNSPLTVVIFGESRNNFSFKPEDFYPGKNICVTGTIQMYKGKPEIIVTSPKVIEIKPEAKHSM